MAVNEIGLQIIQSQISAIEYHLTYWRLGDSYDNALAETINGLWKAEVVHRLGPWKSMDAVERETLKWVDWFNKRRLLEPIGNIPPAEAEEKYCKQQNEFDMVARNEVISLRENRGGSITKPWSPRINYMVEAGSI